MHVYTSTTTAALERIARTMGVDLYEYQTARVPSRGRFAGHDHGHRFLLRPITDDYRAASIDDYCKAGVRRKWAVSWAGHYVFMRAVLELDAQAVIHTSHATYRGLHGAQGFEALAWPTGGRNVGSMVDPQSYRAAQAPHHLVWHDENDLIALAAHAATTRALRAA